MSAVIAAPELITDAARQLAAIGSTVDAAHLTVAAPTELVLPPAADEVSAAIAQLFSAHGQTYQALAGQAAAFDDEFVQHVTASAGAYASAEAANIGLLQSFGGIARPTAAATQAADVFGSLQGLVAGLVNTAEETFSNLIVVSAFLLIFSFIVASVTTAAIASQLGVALFGMGG